MQATEDNVDDINLWDNILKGTIAEMKVGARAVETGQEAEASAERGAPHIAVGAWCTS